jgi:hypothetical protein
MMTSVQGVYREGKIELTEPPANVSDGTPVIVTFLSIASLGLASFADDWNSPEMAAYDNYHEAKSKL